MIDGLSDWLRSVKESLRNVYDEARKVGSNFVEWCVDAPVVVSVLVGSTGALLGWLYLVSYSSNPKPWVRGTGVSLQLVGFILAAYGLERTLEKFGQRSSTSRILPWWKELPSIFQTSRDEEIVLHGEPAKISVEAGTGRVEYSNLSLSERVKRLEERIDELEENV